MKERTICRIVSALSAITLAMALAFVPAAYAAEPEDWKAEVLCGVPVYTLMEEDGVLYAGTGSGVYQYTGDAWAAMNDGLTGDAALHVFALIYASNGALFAGTRDGIYRYDGKSWTSASAGLGDGDLYIGAFLESADGSLYCGWEGGVSVYDGEKWVAMSTGLYADETVLPAYKLIEVGGTLYAGTFGYGVFMYDGKVWRAVNEGLADNGLFIYALTKDGETLYAGTADGMYTYDGNNWTRIGERYEEHNAALGLAKAGDAVYMGTGSGVYRFDGAVVSAMGGSFIAYDFAVLGGVLYAGTNGGVYQYDGENWSARNEGLLVANPFVCSLTSGGALYAGTRGAGVYRLDGETWTILNDGLIGYGLYVNALFESDGTVYAGTLDGVHRYDGVVWTPMNEGLEPVPGVVGFVKTETGFYIGTTTGIYRYEDGVWAPLNEGLGDTDLGVYTLTEAEGTLYAGARSNVYRYADGAWSPANDGLEENTSIWVLTALSGEMYAGTADGVFVYNGDQWEKMSGCPEQVYVLYEGAGRVLYAGAADGVYSYDGVRWELLGAGKEGELRELYAFLESDGKVYAGGEAGLYSAPSPGGTTATRADVLSLLMSVIAIDSEGDQSISQFDDVPEDSDYYEAVLRARQLGVVSGVGNNKFMPEAAVTRQDLYVMLYNALKAMDMLPAAQTGQAAEFDDLADVSGYAKTAIQTLSPYISDGETKLKEALTWAEAAETIHGILSQAAP